MGERGSVNAPVRLADAPFDRLADPQEMAAFMRDRLASQINGMKQVLLLACFDKAKMVTFLEELGADAGADAVTEVLDQTRATSGWLVDVSAAASRVAARVFAAVCQIADVPADEPSEADLARSAWDDALAEHDREYARWETLGSGYTDEESDAIAADYNPAMERLIVTPAPDLPALLRKFEVIWPEDQRRGDAGRDTREFYNDLCRLAAAA